MHRAILAVLLPLAAFAASEVRTWPVTGVVTEECAVAVEVNPALYAAATRGRDNALLSELRVRDAKGRDVPYAVRPQKIRSVEETKEWHSLRITRVAESDGRLVVEAEFPSAAGSPLPDRFVALKVATPLTDFEQSVEVASDGVALASGVLCDYRRFADLRVTEMPFAASFRRALTVTFERPTSEKAAAAFERTIRENGEGKLEAKSVRESVVNRPFRIDSIAVAVPRTRTTFKDAPPMEVMPACTVETDANAKKTTIAFSAFQLPVTALAVNATDRNFSRKVDVLRRVDGRWHPLASGRIGAVNLPGESRRSLEIKFGRALQEDELRVEIENLDNPPLALEDLPVTLKVTPLDIAFVAAPDEKYSLCVVNGAERPRYDSQILDYIDRVQDPVRLDLSLNDQGAWGKDAPTSFWLTTPGNVIPFVSVLVFAALGIICIRLLKSTGPREEEE